MAVSADSIIHTLQGDHPLAAIHNGAVFCFTWDGGKISVGLVKITEPYLATTWRVVFADGASLRVTEGQLFLRRPGKDNGFETPTLDLKAEEPLFGLYLTPTTHGYPTYRQVRANRCDAEGPGDRRPRRIVSRMVWEWMTDERLQRGMRVRHKDNVRTNAHPLNLLLKGKPDYRSHNRALKFINRLKEINRMRLPQIEGVNVPVYDPDAPPKKPKKRHAFRATPKERREKRMFKRAQEIYGTEGPRAGAWGGHFKPGVEHPTFNQTRCAEDGRVICGFQEFGEELVYDLDTLDGACSNVAVNGTFLTIKGQK